MDAEKPVLFEVVERDGEKLFATQGMYLDCIEAHDFYEASISVKRGNKEVVFGCIKYNRREYLSIPKFDLCGAISCLDRSDPLLPTELMLGDEVRITPSTDFCARDYREAYVTMTIVSQQVPREKVVVTNDTIWRRL